jgi:hypothetical protein
MIQRIQSVFLFAALCFTASMFYAPVAVLEHDICGKLTFTLAGFQSAAATDRCGDSPQYSIMAFGILICALTLITIFLYKRRTLQLRLCIYNMLLLAGLLGVIFFVACNITNAQKPDFRLPIVFPVIAIILHYLAFRGIRKDDLMVKALDRLR